MIISKYFHGTPRWNSRYSLWRTLFSCLLACCVLPFSEQNANAQIALSDVLVHFKAGERPIQNVTVRNHAEEPIYVTAEAEQVVNPSDKKSARVKTDNLLVAPTRFSIEGKGQRTVRLLLKSPSKEVEEIYRVKFLPQLRSFDVNEKPTGRPQAFLKVLTGMGILIFSDPLKPVHKFSWKRDKQGITFQNEGNRNVRLSDGKACPNEDSTQCEPLQGKRVYAGASFQIEVAPEKVVKFMKQDGYDGDIEIITIPPAA